MSSRIPALSNEDVLALRAATDPLPTSLDSWLELVAVTPFDQIETNTQRIAPAIYTNLQTAGAFAERERLRGTYKYSWARNTRALHEFAPVVRKLELARVNYRLIKGVAVQLTLGNIGSRIMGDIDLVVREVDVETVHGILLSHGFKPNFTSPCAVFHTGTPRDALNYNSGRCHVDVHIAEHKEPSLLYKYILKKPPMKVELDGTHYLIPEATLLLITAAVHGAKNFSATDLIQSCTDIALLSQGASAELVKLYAQETQTKLAVNHMYRVLETADLECFKGGIPSEVLVGRIQAFLILKRTTARRLRKQLLFMSNLSRRYQERRLPASVIARAYQQLDGRRLLYAIWLATGRFARVEQFLLRGKSSFLTAPKHTLDLPGAITSCEAKSNKGINVSRASQLTQDWRFTIELAQPQKILTMTLESKFFDKFDASLYWNGKHHVRIVSGDASMLHIVFKRVPRTTEFSIRPIFQLCPDCSQSLNDLQIFIDLPNN